MRVMPAQDRARTRATPHARLDNTRSYLCWRSRRAFFVGITACRLNASRRSCVASMALWRSSLASQGVQLRGTRPWRADVVHQGRFGIPPPRRGFVERRPASAWVMLGVVSVVFRSERCGVCCCAANLAPCTTSVLEPDGGGGEAWRGSRGKRFEDGVATIGHAHLNLIRLIDRSGRHACSPTSS